MKLSKSTFQKISNFILQNGRNLDKALFKFYFENGTKEDVIFELKKYQNSDGGFGHGLEPDFKTPTSSSIATTLAVQYLERIGISQNEEILQNALNYFSETFLESEEKWKAVPKDVNNFPHAPWWHIDEKTGNCLIDLNWENPTVEIIGLLQKYPNSFDKLKLKNLVQKTIEKLFDYKEKIESEHSLYCYVSFYFHSSTEIQEKVKSKLDEIILGTVNKNPEDWKTKYVPKPLQFVDIPNSPFYKLFPDLIEKNLDFLVETAEEDGIWLPAWKWNNFEEDWQKAKIEWTGKIAVENLMILKRFLRIEA